MSSESSSNRKRLDARYSSIISMAIQRLLRAVYENDETFRQWVRDYKEAFVRADLAKHDAIKMLISKFGKDIEDMNAVLLRSKTSLRLSAIDARQSARELVCVIVLID